MIVTCYFFRRLLRIYQIHKIGTENQRTGNIISGSKENSEALGKQTPSSKIGDYFEFYDLKAATSQGRE